MAIQRVLKDARIGNNKPLKSRNFTLLILLDIKNAFNSISWKAIKDSLRVNKILKYLQKIINSYLSNREVAREGEKRKMTAGVQC